MTKIKSKFTALILWAVLALTSVSLLAGGMFYKAGAEYDATPSEFGQSISEVVSGGDTYLNYKYGYEKLDADRNVVATAAGYNVVAGDTFARNKIDVDTMLETVAKGGVNVDDVKMQRVYGAGWSQSVADSIESKIKAKYKEVYADGVPGIATGDVEVWGDNGAAIKQEYRYGDSTANPDGGEGGNVNNSAIVYSRRLDKAFFLNNEFMHEYSSRDMARALGAPLTDAGTFKLSGDGYVSAPSLPAASSFKTNIAENEYTAMIFEKGVIIKSGDSCSTYVGGVFKMSDSEYKVMPFIRDQDIMAWQTSTHAMNFIGDIDGQWHPIIDIYTSYDAESATPYTMKVNFKGGSLDIAYELIKDEVDQGEPQQASAMRYAGYNFDKDGNKVKLPLVSVNDDAYLFGDAENPSGGRDTFVEAGALAYYKNYKKDGTAQDMKDVFKAAYTKYFNADFVPGYRCSSIKMWDLCVLDYKYGDGKTGFDTVGSGGRERMTTLVLNPVKNEAFAVYNEYFNIFKNDSGFGRKTLGYPISDVQKDKEIGGVTYAEIQIFEKGYIYKASNGNFITRTGVLYDEENNDFIPTPAPAVYSQYGMLSEEPVIKDNAYYFNYEKGAIKATLNNKGNHFFYDYYPGRNFNMLTLEAKLLPMDLFMREDMLAYDGLLPAGADFADIKTKLVAAYKKKYDTGFFPGFLEETFKGGWNSVYAQQLILGDSSADIFGESRPGVSALVYNNGNIFFMTGSIVAAWQKGSSYELRRGPQSDEYQVEGYPYYFQNFERGIAVRLGDCAFFADYRTAQEYLERLPNYTVPNYGKDGYIGMKTGK